MKKNTQLLPVSLGYWAGKSLGQPVVAAVADAEWVNLPECSVEELGQSRGPCYLPSVQVNPFGFRHQSYYHKLEGRLQLGYRAHPARVVGLTKEV